MDHLGKSVDAISCLCVFPDLDKLELTFQPMDMDIKVDYAAFQENKRERIEELRKPQGQSCSVDLKHSH